MKSGGVLGSSNDGPNPFRKITMLYRAYNTGPQWSLCWHASITSSQTWNDCFTKNSRPMRGSGTAPEGSNNGYSPFKRNPNFCRTHSMKTQGSPCHHASLSLQIWNGCRAEDKQPTFEFRRSSSKLKQKSQPFKEASKDMQNLHYKHAAIAMRPCLHLPPYKVLNATPSPRFRQPTRAPYESHPGKFTFIKLRCG